MDRSDSLLKGNKLKPTSKALYMHMICIYRRIERLRHTFTMHAYTYTCIYMRIHTLSGCLSACCIYNSCLEDKIRLSPSISLSLSLSPSISLSLSLPPCLLDRLRLCFSDVRFARCKAPPFSRFPRASAACRDPQETARGLDVAWDRECCFGLVATAPLS